MISWIQRTFQHHFRMIFAILLGITIISFIATIGATPGIGRGDHELITRDFFGNNLASRAEMQRVTGDAALSIELQYGYSGLDEQQIQKYAFERIAALHLADVWHLPAATSAEEVAYIKGLRIFADDKGQFDANRYITFQSNLKNNPGSSEADIARVIADDVRVQSVRALLDGPGYVQTADVAAGMTRADTSWKVAIATVDYASFLPALSPTDAELAKFFQDNIFRYQIPPRVIASYVDFPATRYVGNIKVSEAEVRAYYDANKARFPNPKAAPAAETKEGDKAKTPPAKVDPNADYAAVRPTVEAALKLERAKNPAAKAASDLAYSLYQAKVPAGPELSRFLTAHKLELKPLAPFTPDTGPVEIGGSAEIGAAALKLNARNYFSEALTTPTGAVVIIWKDLQPARTPLLPEVKAKVLADYIEGEKRKRFVELGRTVRAQIEARLKAGDTFDKAVASAATASSVKITVQTLPSFTLRARPKELVPATAGTLEHLAQGQVSDMVIDANQGYLVYAAERKAPDLNPSSPGFATMRANIAGYMARLGASDYLGEVVAAELKRSEPVAR